MFITYVSQWLYTVMQLPVPIVLSPNHIYSISIFNLFTGALILGIFLILLERAFNGLRWSDFTTKEKVPESSDVVNSSNSLSGYDNIGRKRFSGNSARSKSSMGQRIVKRKNSESDESRRERNLKAIQDYNKRWPHYDSFEEYKKSKGKE